MKSGIFTTKRNPNAGLSVYHNDLFLGLYLPVGGSIEQFSGNDKSLYNLDLMLTFMLEQHPDTKLYSHESIAGNQFHLIVAIKKPITSEGIVKEYILNKLK